MVSFYQPAQQCECRWRWPVMWQDECHPGLGCSLPHPRFGTKPCRVSWWPPEGDRWHCTKINQLLWCWVTIQLVTTSGVIKEVQQRTGLNVQQEEWKCTSPLYKINNTYSTTQHGQLFTCSSEPSVVTMVTEWAPCVASSWAGMVMVVPSWVTMVIVPPIACKSASEILTWYETQYRVNIQFHRKSFWHTMSEV